MKDIRAKRIFRRREAGQMSERLCLTTGMKYGVGLSGVALLLFFIAMDSGVGEGGVPNDEAFDQIPVTAANGIDAQLAAKGRSLEKPPAMMMIVPIMHWPIRNARDKQVIGEILRIYPSKLMLRFLVSEKAYMRTKGAKADSVKGIDDHILLVEPFREKGFTWELLWRGLLKITQRHLLDVDWFIVSDLDTLVVSTNIAAYTSYLNPDQAFYLGHVSGLDTWNKEGVLYNDRGAFVLSRKALQLFATRVQHLDEEQQESAPQASDPYECADAPGVIFDSRVGACLREVGVEPAETRDSKGRQRFLANKPSKREDFRKCSNYPLSFSKISTLQQFQTLEYYTLKQPYVDAYLGIEPPISGKPFRMGNTDSSNLQMDANGNLPSLGGKRAVGSWLKNSEKAPNCLKKDDSSSCPCQVQLPSGIESARSQANPCKEGATLAHGGECAMKCREGDGGSGVARCYNGFLMLPSLPCNGQKKDSNPCRIPAEHPNTIFTPKSGSYIDSGKQLAVTCAQGYQLPGADSRAEYVCYRGNLGLGQTCQKCGEWTLQVEGSRYNVPAWKDIKINGVASDTFTVTGVAAGSDADPVKNCGQFSLPEQLILVEASTMKFRYALSCSNNEFEIKSAAFRETGQCEQ